MKRIDHLLLGALGLFALAVIFTVIIPYIQTNNLPSWKYTYQYSDNAWQGRQIYIREGCSYCHTQQVRPWKIVDDHIEGVPADAEFGRTSDPRDYANDKPHLLGTERTGPDLAHVASRMSMKDWHISHIKNPRSEVAHSIMPAFPFLTEKELDQLSDYILSLQ